MSAPSNSHRQHSPWIEWLSGLILGLITAALLVITTSTIYPDLEDYGIDLGLRLNVGLTSVDFKPLPNEPIISGTSHSIHYVFLDVDPGGNGSSPDSSDGACNALKKPRPRTNNFELSALQCQPTRPLNRYLLTEVLDTLKELNEEVKLLAKSENIRAIVLDVILAKDPATEDEDKALRPAMKEWEYNHTPIIYAADASLPFRNDDSLVALEPDQEDRYPGKARIAFPVADSAIRHYHRCFFTNTSPKQLESLPYQIARAVNLILPECGAAKAHPDDERIIYTLPSLEAHADSPEIDTRAYALAFRYQPIYRRCLAANLWNPDSECSRPETYQGAIVIVGASNPFRRDRHYTPLGEMSGAEVLINATHSFLLYPDQKEKTFREKLEGKAWITFLCSLVWLTYHLIHHRMAMHRNNHLSIWARMQVWVLNKLAFLMTLATMVALATWLSFRPESSPPNLDVFLPVLAIALEQYAEFAERLLRFIEMLLTKLFGAIASMSREHKHD